MARAASTVACHHHLDSYSFKPVTSRAGRAAVWTVMRAVWETVGDFAEARRGLFALPFISGPSLTNVRACFVVL